MAMDFIDPLELAWFAGIFEGEGSIILPTAQPQTVTLSIFMTDEDVILRIQRVLGVGNVRGPYLDKKRPTAKPIYKWTTGRRKEVARLLLAIYPYLSARRRVRVSDALLRLSYKRTFPCRTCEHGVEGPHRCPQCRKAWRADHYEKQKRVAAEVGIPIRYLRMKEVI